MVDPIAFSLLPEAGVPASHLLYGHDGKVSRDVEVGCYWLLSSLVLDVTVVSIEPGSVFLPRTASCISCIR